MSQQNWETILHERLPAFGHRNWIVIADSAYPAQTAPGIEVVLADEPHAEVVSRVLAAVDAHAHLRPTVLLDSEIGFVSEQAAPGVDALRESLKQAIGARDAAHSPHEEILAELDAAGRLYKILVIKTPLCIPYTSVFLRLECGYWTAAAEQQLRARMQRLAE
jgi:L-fucose mutarotase/ribose pyranase (RbsD/FucU family)